MPFLNNKLLNDKLTLQSLQCALYMSW